MSYQYRQEDLYVRQFHKVVEYLNLSNTQEDLRKWDLISVTPIPGVLHTGYHLLYKLKEE